MVGTVHSDNDNPFAFGADSILSVTSRIAWSSYLGSGQSPSYPCGGIRHLDDPYIFGVSRISKSTNRKEPHSHDGWQCSNYTTARYLSAK